MVTFIFFRCIYCWLYISDTFDLPAEYKDKHCDRPCCINLGVAIRWLAQLSKPLTLGPCCHNLSQYTTRISMDTYCNTNLQNQNRCINCAIE